jgi:hypothetical protein
LKLFCLKINNGQKLKKMTSKARHFYFSRLTKILKKQKILK